MVRLKVLEVLRAAASVLDVYERLEITERELRCQLAERLKSFLPPVCLMINFRMVKVSCYAAALSEEIL